MKKNNTENHHPSLLIHFNHIYLCWKSLILISTLDSKTMSDILLILILFPILLLVLVSYLNRIYTEQQRWNYLLRLGIMAYFAKIAEKSIEVEREAPPHSTDIYHWVEHLLGHHTQVWILALADILDENNKRITQQLSAWFLKLVGKPSMLICHCVSWALSSPQ